MYFTQHCGAVYTYTFCKTAHPSRNTTNKVEGSSPQTSDINGDYLSVPTSTRIAGIFPSHIFNKIVNYNKGKGYHNEIPEKFFGPKII